MISKGKSRKQIEEAILKKYNVSKVTFDRDIKSALEVLKDSQDSFNQSIKSIMTERYELLGEAAIKDSDLRAAMQILKQESDIFGLNIQKTEIDLDKSQFEIKFE